MGRRDDGFTLVEVLAALTLFAIVHVAFSSLSTMTMRANAQARQLSVATWHARDKLEELRGTTYPTLNGGSDRPDALYTRTWTVSAGPAARTKAVQVRVAWTDKVARQITVTSVLAE